MIDEAGERPPGSYRWVWFFVALGAICILVFIILSLFNSNQQLSAEELQAARARWKKHGLGSYVLRYKVKVVSGAGDRLENSYVVTVYKGRVISVQLDGRPQNKKQFKNGL